MKDRPNFLRSRVCYAATMLIGFLGLCACGDNHTGDGGWDVGDDAGSSTQPHAITQGRYRASLEIHRDECEPSLASLDESNTGWPPEEMGVRIYPEPTVVVWIYEFRTRRSHVAATLSGRLRDDLVPVEPLIIEHMWPEAQHWEAECDASGFKVEMKTHVRVKAVDSETMIIELETDWDGLKDACSDDDLTDEDRRWLPVERCSESYSYRLELVEACEPVGECLTDVGDTPSGGRDYSMPAVNCHCD